MGKLFSKKRDVKVRNVISINDLKKYPNLVVKGEIIIAIDESLKIPEVEIRLDNYFPAVARLWPGDVTNRLKILPLL